MRQMAARFATLPASVQLALALVAGAAGALAHAPFLIAPAILVPLVTGFVLLCAASSARVAFIYGWALGLGYFALTLTWITEPFQVDAATTGWMAPFALVLLGLLLGAFWAGAVGFARWAGVGAPALIIAWSGAEMLRAYVFTGFPWGSPPQALVDSVAGQSLALGGPHGVMLAMVAAVGIAVHWPRGRVVGPMILGGLGVILLVPLTTDLAPLTAHTIRLVQPNAPQDEKWDPEMIPIFVNRQIEYTAADGTPDLIIWPETTLPYLVENAQPAFDVIADAARGVPVALGIQRRDGRDYFNSMVVLDGSGTVTQTYDKHHLVPFGEYMPFEWFFRHINVGGLAARADGGYTAGPGPQLVDFGMLGTALPLICYEAVFAHDVGAAPERPAFLMQLTNDAWFGARSGPQQHLAQARMRAIEQGLPMVRAANTGISGVIDPKGRVIASIPLNTAGYLDAALPVPGALTIYARTGDLPWLILICAGLIATVLRRARTRQAVSIDADTPDA